MHTFFLLAQKTYRINLQYKYTQLLNAAVTSLVGLVLIYVWKAGSAPYGGIKNFTTENLVHWVAFGQVLFNCIHPIKGLDIQRAVRSGNIGVYFLRPINFFTHTICSEFGRQVYCFVFKSIPVYLVYYFVVGLRIHGIKQIMLIFFSMILGIYLALCLSYLVGISSLFTTDIRWADTLNFSLLCLASGTMIPISLIPGKLGVILKFTPWASLMNPSCSIFINKFNNSIFKIPITWAIVLTILCLYLTYLGRKKIEIQGG